MDINFTSFYVAPESLVEKDEYSEMKLFITDSHPQRNIPPKIWIVTLDKKAEYAPVDVESLDMRSFLSLHFGYYDDYTHL